MSNLLIIGNGFDRAHHLKTAYKYFRNYLFACATGNEYVDGSMIEKPRLPDVHIHTGKEILCDLRAECEYLFWVLGNATKKEQDIEWCKFEELLGNLDHRKMLEENSCDELAFMGIRDSLGTLENIFFEWIKTINIEQVSGKKFLETFINRDEDLFINFNYTETVESVYGVKEDNICYIHGKREMDPQLKEKYKMTCFGTGNQKLVIGYDRKKWKPNRKFAQYRGTEMFSMLATLDMDLIKDTEEILWNSKVFLDKVRETKIQNVLSFGFSFSEVDRPQLKAICAALNGSDKNTKKMIWYLNDYDKGKNRRFKRSIRKCGYKGKFRLYNSDDEYKET